MKIIEVFCMSNFALWRHQAQLISNVGKIHVLGEAFTIITYRKIKNKDTAGLVQPILVK